MIVMPWSPMVPLSSTTSPGRARSPAISTPGGTRPTPAVLMNSLSALPRSTTLVSPVTICTPACSGRGRHRGDDPLQIGQGQPLFDDEPGAEPQRPGAAHAQVVDRAADGQLADVAAGEEEGADHVAVGGEGQARAVGIGHWESEMSRRRPSRRAGAGWGCRSGGQRAARPGRGSACRRSRGPAGSRLAHAHRPASRPNW